MRAALGQALSRAPDPVMEMNASPMDRLLFLLQRAGADSCWIEFTDHGGELGAFVFCSKATRAP
jgi:hypothetical protein